MSCLDFHLKVREFNKLRKMDLKEKIIFSKKVIGKALNDFGDKIGVSCSFGKDSTVVLHLVLQVKPRIPVLFANTLVEHPETLKFKEFLKKKWNLNLFEARPDVTFWDLVRKYGFPRPRRSHDKRKNGEPAAPRCCWYLKEKPLLLLVRKLGLEALFLGLTWAESNVRRWLFIDRGPSWYVKKQKIWKVSPIGYWNKEDVWKYIEEYGLPVNKIYEKEDRTGCRVCTAYRGWEKHLAKNEPKLYRFIIRKMREMGDNRGHFFLDEFIGDNENG